MTKLSSAQENLLLATRCFGRGTPFPHRLMQNLLIKLDNTLYQAVINDLLKQKIITKEGKFAFSLTPHGLRLRPAGVVPSAIWDAAVAVMKPTVAQTIDADERFSVDLLAIHTVALANILRTKIPPLYMELLGLCVICHDYLGHIDEVEVYQRRLQVALDDWHSKK